jgi:hypothetical protein
MSTDKLLCQSCACAGGCSRGPVALNDYCREYRPKDSCACQFCRQRRTCTTPGDVNCKEGMNEAAL